MRKVKFAMISAAVIVAVTGALATNHAKQTCEYQTQYYSKHSAGGIFENDNVAISFAFELMINRGEWCLK